MALKFQIKRGLLAPGTGALAVGELGYDTVAKKIYVGNGPSLNPTIINNDASKTSTSAQPPANPEPGDLWWSSNEIDGALYVYYNDGDGSPQWVQINTILAGPDSTVPLHVRNITTTNISNWNEAYDNMGTGGGGITQELDPVFLASPAYNITSVKIGNWDAAYGWGNHSTAGYLTTETDPTVPSYVKSITTTNISNWNEAYDNMGTGGGGGITEELDPVFMASPAYNITSVKIGDWDAAFAWGDHSTAGYLTAEADTLDSVATRGNTTNSATINFATTNEVAFNTTSNRGTDLGKLGWNTSDQTLQVGLGNGVVLQLGQETLYVVRNATGSTILNGTPVSCTGVTPSGRLEISPSTGTIDPVTFLGIATQDITNGVNGKVVHFGYVNGLDTRGTAASSLAVGNETWAEGDKLYIHPTVAGKLTNVEPEAPKVKICVASVIVRHQTTGILFVRPTSNLDLTKLSDVQISSVANNEILVYNGTANRWENKTSANLDLLTATTAASTYQPVGTYATLTDGKLSDSVLPAIAITDTFVVASQSAMLALTAETGDVAIRTDINSTFILSAGPASTLSNWKELLTPADGVQSVSGTAPISSTGGVNPTLSISTATTSAAGSMSAADKTKLNGIAENANNYSHPTGFTSSLSNLSGPTVVSDIFITTEGHVSGIDTRTLTPTDIGAATTGDLSELSTAVNNKAVVTDYSETLSSTNWNGIGLRSTLLTNEQKIFNVTSSGASSYVINGSNNPSITLVRGVTYTFNINASGHPFNIQTSEGSFNSANLYSDGVTGNGTQVGVLTFVVPLSGPSTLYYVCSFHSSMNGTINIIDDGDIIFDITGNTNYNGPFASAIDIPGILATDAPIIDLNMSSVAFADIDTVNTEWGKIYRAVTYNGGITFYAKEETTIALALQVKVVK
jgi:hypothetical protein